jgi:hypothetical protein
LVEHRTKVGEENPPNPKQAGNRKDEGNQAENKQEEFDQESETCGSRDFKNPIKVSHPARKASAQDWLKLLRWSQMSTRISNMQNAITTGCMYIWRITNKQTNR